jgi:hypothetical protein
MGDENPGAGRRRTRLAWMIALALSAAVPAAIAFGNAAANNRKVERAVHGSTRIRVWAAGIRTNPDGKFCGCAIVARPERMLYETTDPGEIRSLVASFRAAPHLSKPLMVSTCGILTIDFLDGERLLASFHITGDLLRSTYRSWWSMELGWEGSARLEEWLKTRGLREKLEASRKDFGASAPGK